ncbi:hypothetical protein RQP46_002665 [Phenoliferia psychrophenolica]
MLPEPLSSQLLTLASTLSNLSTSLPTSLTSALPLLLTLTTLYFTLLSLYSTTRLFLRLSWLFVKWGALAAAVGTAYSGWTQSGWTGSVANIGRAGGGMYDIGRRGLEWWAQGTSAGVGQPTTGGKGTRRTGKGRRGGAPKSASGKQRTWATTNPGGGFDDADANDNGGVDPIKEIQNSLLSFLNTPPPPKPQDSTKKSTGKSRPKKDGPSSGGGLDLTALAKDWAWGKATKAWNDLGGAGGRPQDERRR